MLDRFGDAGRAAAFYVLALGLAVVCSLAAPVLDRGVLLLTMFTPLAAVLLMMLVFTREGRSRTGWVSLGLTHAGWRGWPLAVLAPIVMLGFSYAVLWATPYASFQAPAEAFNPVGFAIGLLIGFVLALGEETGWRGYMLPRLTSLGVVPAMLIVGFFHGVWHLPLIFLTPFYHSDGNLMIIVPLFLVTLTLAGVFFGYLRIVTGSVWPAVIAHAVHNEVWAFLRELTTGPSPQTIEYLGGESGLFEIAALVALAVLLLRWLRRRPVAAVTATP